MSAKGQIRDLERENAFLLLALDAADGFSWTAASGIRIAARPDSAGMWVLLREAPGHAPLVWDGDGWREPARDGWRGQWSQRTALTLGPQLKDRENTEYTAWHARRTQQDAAPAREEHLAEYAQNGAAA